MFESLQNYPGGLQRNIIYNLFMADRTYVDG
jgi:hypothetical protein